MEPFKINLNQMAETKGRYKRFLLILAIILIIAAVITFSLFHHKNDPGKWVFLSFGSLAIMYIYFAYVGYVAKIYISADDFAIEYQFGFFMKAPTAIIWEVVDKVKIGPTYITFFKKSGRGKKIELGWLPYKKVVEIKERIQQYSEVKGIEIEVAEYNKI
jgi:phosphoglycerol transferase MdoB-like AlkP superfamily enzyme